MIKAKKIFNLLILLACMASPVAAQTAKVTGPYVDPSGDNRISKLDWSLVENMSDDFDGETIDLKKWQIEPRENGWYWIGRPPGLFKTDTIKLEDSKLKVTVGVLPEPQVIRGQKYLYEGAIVRSIHPGGPGMYFETRMKANKTEMSSTFWLVSKGGKFKQELDIQECIGKVSDDAAGWAKNWSQIFHSNMILVERGVEGKTQIQRQLVTPQPNHEAFYVYAAWWKSAREVQFFFNGKYAYSLEPGTDWDLPAYLQMAIETYHWNPVPKDGGLIATASESERTTQYDWIRVWKLNNGNASLATP